jgi:osmoprotectant transport system substrate-binding protein
MSLIQDNQEADGMQIWTDAPKSTPKGSGAARGRRDGRRGSYRRGLALLLVGLAALLAACGSSSPSSTQPGAGKPAVTIGSKNFAESNILGELYAQALRAKGFKVNLIPNVGSTEIIYKALTGGRIGMYPEYTGVLLSTIAGKTKNPPSAQAAYEEAKAYVAKDGLTMLNYTPFYDADAIATLPEWASKKSVSSIADLKPLGKGVTLGGPAEFATRFEGLIGLKQEYGVVPTFKPIAIELSYKALETKQVDTQVVFTTDGQLVGGHFKLLEDPKHVFGFQNVAPLVSKKVLEQQGPAFEETLNKVSALLTIPAIQEMNKAVSIDKESPASVAERFLKANHLA